MNTVEHKRFCHPLRSEHTLRYGANLTKNQGVYMQCSDEI